MVIFRALLCLLIGTLAIAATPAALAPAGEPVLIFSDDFSRLSANPVSSGLWFEAAPGTEVVHLWVVSHATAETVLDLTLPSLPYSFHTGALPNGTYSVWVTTSKATYATTVEVAH